MGRSRVRRAEPRPPSSSGRWRDVLQHAHIAAVVAGGPVTTAGARRGGGSPVVTGGKIGLQASGGNESANHFLGAGVMMRC